MWCLFSSKVIWFPILFLKMSTTQSAVLWTGACLDMLTFFAQQIKILKANNRNSTYLIKNSGAPPLRGSTPSHPAPHGASQLKMVKSWLLRSMGVHRHPYYVGYCEEIKIKYWISRQFWNGTPGPSGGFESAQKCQILVVEVHGSP